MKETSSYENDKADKACPLDGVRVAAVYAGAADDRLRPEAKARAEADYSSKRRKERAMANVVVRAKRRKPQPGSWDEHRHVPKGWRLPPVKIVRIRVLSVFTMLLFSSGVFAQECESIIALSKVINTVVSDSETVYQHADNFCNEYRHYQQDVSSSSYGASYKFLSATFGRRNASVHEVASRYCSASNSYEASDHAYKQYTESIAPNAYEAYSTCLEMSDSGLKFNVTLASILPTEFSLSVAYDGGKTEHDTSATVRFSPSSDVSCEWDKASEREQIVK